MPQTASDLFSRHREAIEHAIRIVGRRNRLTGGRFDDFGQECRLRTWCDDAALLRRLTPTGNPVPYLTRAFHSVLIDRWRAANGRPRASTQRLDCAAITARRRWQRTFIADFDQLPSVAASPEQSTFVRELRRPAQRVRSALAHGLVELPRRNRRFVWRALVNDVPILQMAREAGVPKDRLYRKLARLRRHLRDRLSRSGVGRPTADLILAQRALQRRG
jgi:DNA-directed RNA polymerase specialized sigma24 family protein